MKHLMLAMVVAAISSVIAIESSASENHAISGKPCPMDELDGDKVALVVGADNYSVYKSEAIKNLDNAVHDARTIATLLSEQGFKVRCLLDPTRLAFNAEKMALEVYLTERTNENALAANTGRTVIYFAGHGYHDPRDASDYLLFPFEADPDKYSGVVDLNSHQGRIAQGRFSILSLTNAFSAIGHGSLFVFDACRASLDIGIPAGPAEPLMRAQLTGRQIAVFSTQPGGFALDSVPNSSEKNGLFTSILARFMELPLASLDHTLSLTAKVVKLNKRDQAPISAHGSDALFSSYRWLERESTDVCDLVDSAIWNVAGKPCDLFDNAECLKAGICTAVTPYLIGASREQAKVCLARHKDKWLHQDLASICEPPPPGPIAISVPPTATAPATASANPADRSAFNIVTIGEAVRTAQQLDTIALSGWASKTPSVFASANRISPDTLSSLPATLDSTLSEISSVTTKEKFVTAQRDKLIAQSGERSVPPNAAPSPFAVDLKGRTVTIRNLPSVNARPIGTFSGNEIVAEIDCYTIPCTTDWVGLRVAKGKAILRGWIPVGELDTAVTSGRSIEVRYDGRRVSPHPDSIEAIRQAIRPKGTSSPASGPIHVMASQDGAQGATDIFLAGARLAFLDRMLIELGVRANDITKTVVNTTSGSPLPPVVINLSRQ